MKVGRFSGCFMMTAGTSSKCQPNKVTEPAACVGSSQTSGRPPEGRWNGDLNLVSVKAHRATRHMEIGISDPFS